MSKETVKRFSVVLIMLIAIVCMILSESVGIEIISGKTSIEDLIAARRTDEWYNFKPSEQIGKSICTPTPFDRNGAYCIDSHTSLVPGGDYKIVNIFDINNGTNKIKSYSKNNPGGTEYNLSHEGAKQLLMLGYLTEKANGETIVGGQTGLGKQLISTLFSRYFWVNALRGVDLSSEFVGWNIGNIENIKNANNTYNTYLTEAEIFADTMIRNGANGENVLALSMTQDEKDSVGVIIDGGKTYIGPYKVSKTQSCTVGEITVNGNIIATGISTDLKTVKSVEKVANKKAFYVVLDSEVDEITSINVKAKEGISSLKSRMVFVGGTGNQNFVIWKSEKTNVQPQVDLPIPSFGKLEIAKKDEFDNSNLNLKDIGFVVWSEIKKAYVTVDASGTAQYVDFATAKKNEFKTDKDGKLLVNGKVQPISNLPVGRYKIFETSIPSSLQKYYYLPEISVPNKDGKDVKTNAKQLKRTVKNGKKSETLDYYEVKSAQTATVTATNKRDYVSLQVIKRDQIDSRLPLNGIEFKIYKVGGNNNKPNGWVHKNSSGEITYGNWDSSVYTLTTDAQGCTEVLDKLDNNATYYIYETKIPDHLKDYYKLDGDLTGPFGTISGVKVKSISNNSKKLKADKNNNGLFKWGEEDEIVNNRDYVSVQMQKTNKDKKKLNGIKFMILDVGKNEWVVTDNTGRLKSTSKTFNKNDTNMAFTTGESVNGYKKTGFTRVVRDLEKDRTYRIYEVDVGEYDELYKLNTFTFNGKTYDGTLVDEFTANNEFIEKLKTDGQYKNGIYDVYVKTKQNTQYYGALNIEKEDKLTGVSLNGIGFKIKTIGRYINNQWLIIDKNTHKVTGYGTFEEATTIYTNSSGITDDILKMPIESQSYSVYEVEIPKSLQPYYTLDQTNFTERYIASKESEALLLKYINKKGKEKSDIALTQEIDSDSSNTKSVVTHVGFENKQSYISLSGIVWEDGKQGKNEKTINNSYGNEDNKIQGIYVSLFDQNGNYVARIDSRGNTITAQQVQTDSNGQYKFDRVRIDQVEAGNYHIEFSYDGITYQPVKNDSGYTETKKVKNNSVPIPNSTTSKAIEDATKRTKLNSAFTALTGEGQTISYNNRNETLNYGTKTGENDRVYSMNTCQWDWTRKEASNNRTGLVKINTQGSFLVRASISDTYLKGAYEKMKGSSNSNGYQKNGWTMLLEIPNLNLGLSQREEADLALSKDTYSADIEINGKKYTYIYGRQLDKKVQEQIEADANTAQVETTLGVAFERDEPLDESLKYKTPIYKADAEYELNNNSGTYSKGELKVTITYAICLVNNSKNLYSKVNKIKEYYSSDYTFANKKVYSDKECTKEITGVTIGSETSINNVKLGNDTTNRNYKSVEIDFGNDGIVLTPKSSKDHVKYIYIKMELPKSSFYDFKNHKLYDTKEFRNFAEISSYTTYSSYNSSKKTGTTYATFDYDSVPNTLYVGNASNAIKTKVNNGQLRQWEDDSDKAPGLMIADAGERTISGVVFKDNALGTIKNTLNMRLGDGIRQAAEKGVKNVTVQLVPADKTASTEGDVQKYYNDRWLGTNKAASKLTVTTNDKGEFTIAGFIPGEYQIRYIWGNGKETTVNDGKTKVSAGEYKSTIYNKDYNGLVDKGLPNNKWYLSANQKTNYSEAVDNQTTRNTIDSNLPASYSDYETYNNDDKAKVNGNMDSWTRTLDMGIEIVGDVDNDYIVVNKDGNAKYQYNISSIDFGLIERPKQQLEIKKLLKHIRIIDAQDRVIVDAELEIDASGNRKFKNAEDVLYTVLLPKSNTNPYGQVKSEIDKELMPLRLEATYAVTVTNTGENDYKNTEFYNFGNQRSNWNSNPVKLKPTAVYDYMNSGASVGDSSEYSVIDKSNYDKQVNDKINKRSTLYSKNGSSKTIVEAGYKKYNEWRNSHTTTQGGTTTTKWAEGYEILESIYEKWWQAEQETRTVREEKLDVSKILNLTKLEKDYAVGESDSCSYSVTLAVTDSEKEIKLGNEAEIIDIDRSSNFGKTTIETYKKLYDSGENVIVTPPTGENRETLNTEENNMLAIIIISALSVLGVGIVGIKIALKSKGTKAN